MTFDKWSKYVDHRRKVHARCLQCDLCGKTFDRKPNLKNHMKIHASDSDQEVYQCDYENCPRYYSAKRNLMAHIRSKHEGKRWICNICDCQMSTKQKLKQHVAAHEDPNRRPKQPMAERLIGDQEN